MKKKFVCSKIPCMCNVSLNGWKVFNIDVEYFKHKCSDFYQDHIIYSGTDGNMMENYL